MPYRRGPSRTPAVGGLTAALAAATVLLACTALLSGCSSASTPSPTSTTSGGQPTSPASSGSPTETVKDITVTYAGGTVTPPPDTVVVEAGTRVRLTLTTDVADELHNHYDDSETAVRAGVPVTLDFVVTKPGVYEIELHEADKVLVRLQVQ